MHRRALRLFVVWLLAAVLPWHGAAFAATAHAAVGEPARSAAAQHADRSAAEAAEAATPCHGGAGEESLPAGDGDPAGKQRSGSTCAAACAMAAAPPFAPLPLTVESALAAAPVAAEAPSVSFLTSGPHRPPKASLA